MKVLDISGRVAQLFACHACACVPCRCHAPTSGLDAGDAERRACMIVDMARRNRNQATKMQVARNRSLLVDHSVEATATKINPGNAMQQCKCVEVFHTLSLIGTSQREFSPILEIDILSDISLFRRRFSLCRSPRKPWHGLESIHMSTCQAARTLSRGWIHRLRLIE